MAASARSSRALLFMQHCRRSIPRQPISSIRHSSPYAPSNFTQPASKSHIRPAFESQADNNNTPPSRRPHYAHPLGQGLINRNKIPRLTPWARLKMLFGWRPPPPDYRPAPFRANNNPYRAHKKWPPDFSTLDPKQQFHFEKTYRRRAALKWARPAWNKSIKILQQTLITFTIIYFVFILEPTHGQGTPFDGFRIWFFNKLGELSQLPDATRQEADKLRDEAKKKTVKSVDMETENSPVPPGAS
ncbi:uncharacterized protein Z518_06138 [Rhinocladiella mackenziei CBS 650.93]|uniref:Uncharacterized protein n=1 Tax=Rhinocladiella mackenziei CBS 650.93 TaxID=1442369 RepID=A0A0D2IQ03_9EURO|nr:uncharacterized protein Z518_06138 [Rhinocladiella mackenziei CBS 650.93]KIX05266.1 hypothetical protein Z518_06138 [Rhinocladiella mackenziei CBS 650.93]